MARVGQVSLRFLGLLVSIVPLLLLSSSLSQVEAREFMVGGQQGWVEKPSQDYNHWASINRFLVNDSLHFVYKQGSDSVLVVKREDYDSCNINQPIKKFDDGHSIFQFHDSGLFYFISGIADHCKNGQKLIVRVLAVRSAPPKTPNPSPNPNPKPSPSPSPKPPSSPSPSPSHSPSPPPQTPSPGPESPVPAPAPSASARIGVSVGFGVAVLLMFTSLVGLV